MKLASLPWILLVSLAATTGSALGEVEADRSGEAILAALKAHGVAVTKDAVIDFRGDKRIDFVRVSFERQSWDQAADLLGSLQGVGQNLALEFKDFPLADDRLAALRGWKNLLFVTIKRCGISDAGLAHLATLPNLRRLDLTVDGLTPGALEPFAGRSALRILMLKGRGLTDEWVPRLAQLGSLEDLWLELHGLSEAGSARLNKALPGAELRLRYPDFPGPRWHLDRSQALVYVLPIDWKQTLNLHSRYDEILLPDQMGRQPNIVMRDQPGTSPLRELKDKYEQDLPKALRDFKPESSEVVATASGGEMIKLIHTNTSPAGIAVRQVNYIVEVGGKRLFVACTAPAEDGNRRDRQFDDFVQSLAKPAAEPDVEKR